MGWVIQRRNREEEERHAREALEPRLLREMQALQEGLLQELVWEEQGRLLRIFSGATNNAGTELRAGRFREIEDCLTPEERQEVANARDMVMEVHNAFAEVWARNMHTGSLRLVRFGRAPVPGECQEESHGSNHQF